MIGETLRRLAFLPVTLFVVATLVFLALRALPGSTVDMLASQFSTAGLRDQLIAQLGLDRALGAQQPQPEAQPRLAAGLLCLSRPRHQASPPETGIA